MFFEVFDKESHKSLGCVFLCHGCGDKSPVRKKAGLPLRWVEKVELCYNRHGRLVKRSSVVNYYCPTCVSCGVNARTVAATTRKLCRSTEKRVA